MVIKKIGLMLSFLGLFCGVICAQNEAAKNFVPGTVLERQAGSSWDTFPKMEIGFVGRQPTNADPMAFVFIRFQSALEIGGGVFSSYYQLNKETNQLEKKDVDSLKQFMNLMAEVVLAGKIAKYRNIASIDMELGEIELFDFQWYMTQNQWKYTRNKTCRIKVKVQTVDGENRLYFYRTSNLKDHRNEFETFTMPDDVYLTEKQCERIGDAYSKSGSFMWKAVDTAINSVKSTLR